MRDGDRLQARSVWGQTCHQVIAGVGARDHSSARWLRLALTGSLVSLVGLIGSDSSDRLWFDSDGCECLGFCAVCEHGSEYTVFIGVAWTKENPHTLCTEYIKDDPTVHFVREACIVHNPNFMLAVNVVVTCDETRKRHAPSIWVGGTRRPAQFHHGELDAIAFWGPCAPAAQCA